MGKLFVGIFFKQKPDVVPLPPIPPGTAPGPTPNPPPPPPPTKTRTMYDSTNPFDIPQNVEMVAGYVDGLYAWSYNGWAYHGSSKQVRITVTGATLNAHVADVERGDLTPTDGAEWCKRKLAAGQTPTLYFSLSLWGQIAAALKAAGIPTGEINAWVADWDNKPVLQSGWVAKQYADSAMVGHHYDVSIVAPIWRGVD